MAKKQKKERKEISSVPGGPPTEAEIARLARDDAY
jgi:hypothetical protein